MSARLGHLTLDTVDLDRAVAFWVAVFEGQVWRAPDGAIAVVSAPGTELMIQRVDSVASGKNPIHLDLFTADLDSELPRLEALGAREVARYAQWGAIWATLIDPDGYLFDVVERAEPS